MSNDKLGCSDHCYYSRDYHTIDTHLFPCEDYSDHCSFIIGSACMVAVIKGIGTIKAE